MGREVWKCDLVLYVQLPCIARRKVYDTVVEGGRASYAQASTVVSLHCHLVDILGVSPGGDHVTNRTQEFEWHS